MDNLADRVESTLKIERTDYTRNGTDFRVKGGINLMRCLNYALSDDGFSPSQFRNGKRLGLVMVEGEETVTVSQETEAENANVLSIVENTH